MKLLEHYKRNKIIYLIVIFIILFALAFVLRLFPIRIAHWWDETVYLQHAEILFSGRTNYNEFSFRPPLLPIIFFLFFFIKHSVVTASFVTALFGALFPVFVFLIGKKIYNLETGIIAGLIATFAPFIVLNSNYLLTDVPALTLISMSFYLALYKENKYLLFLSGVFLSLSILMKFTLILMTPILLLYLLLYKVKFNQILIFGIGAFLAILPYLIWAQFYFGSFLTPFIKGSQMVGDTNEYLFYYFNNINEAFTILIPVGLILFFILYSYRLIKKDYRNLRINIVMACWIIIFFFYLSITPHKELRYILPIAIPIILLASNGFVLLFSKFNKRLKAILMVVIILYIFSFMFSTYGWEVINAGNFVNQSESDEMVLSKYILNDLNYAGIIYTNQRYPVIAYYTGLETRQLWPYNNSFYQLIPIIMPDSGLIIGMFGVKNPQPLYLDRDPRFQYANEIGDFFIYNYTPSNFSRT